MNFVRQYARPVLARWRIVIAVLVVTVIGTAAWTFTRPGASWTATTALTTQSQNRAPDQDAVLSLGYVDYFNQATYQQLLRAEANVPPSVTLKAGVGAASPIIYISATASSPETARSAAVAAAGAFQLDIRDSLVAERQREVADLQKQVDDAVTQLQKPGTTPAEGNVILDQIRSLQGRITDISSDATNTLKTLQDQPGLASTLPSPALDIVAGLVAGLVLGVLVALALVLVDGRIRGRSDVDRLGQPTLAELPRDQSAQRTLAVERLLNRLGARTSGAPDSVAVIGVGTGLGYRFALDLATVAATRRARAVLVRADMRSHGPGSAPGLADVLRGHAEIEHALDVMPSGLAVLHVGDPDGRDPFELLEPDRTADLVTTLDPLGGLTVIDAAPLERAPESQVVAAAVDRVILVVERAVTRRSDLKAALEQLSQVKAIVAGVVIDSPDVGATAAQVDADVSTHQAVIPAGSPEGPEANGSRHTVAAPALVGAGHAGGHADVGADDERYRGVGDSDGQAPQGGRDGESAAHPLPSPRPRPRPRPEGAPGDPHGGRPS